MKKDCNGERNYYNFHYFLLEDDSEKMEYLLLISDGEVFGYGRYSNGSCVFVSNEDVSSLLRLVEIHEMQPSSIQTDRVKGLADRLIKIFPRGTPLPASSIALSSLVEEFRGLLPTRFIVSSEHQSLGRNSQ